MKRSLFISTGLVLVILFAASLVLLRRSVPFPWGNDFIAQKVEDFLERSAEFDCLFIGSSRTYHHIDVQLFDQLTGRRSYNMGCGGMYLLETHFILEHLLEHHPNPDQLLVFQQEENPYSFRRANLHTIRSKYYMDSKRMKMGFTHFWDRGLEQQAFFHLLSFLENQFCLGMGFEVITYHLRTQNHQLQEQIKVQNGFYSIDQRNAYEKANPAGKRVRSRNRPYVPDEKNPFADAPVELNWTTPGALNLSVPVSSKIQFCRIAPIVLAPEHYFNYGHFNEKGAKAFTRKLATAFLKLDLER
ncbi:MAG: hypothetical protein AAF985_17065 [Bacteroidota bacterium]